MTKKALVLFLASMLGILSWAGAQAARTDLFDLRRSQQELEIMRGILSTTLTFVVNELRIKESKTEQAYDALTRAHWGTSNVSAYYLYGQGAVFIVPLSSFRYLLGGKLATTAWASFREAEAQLAEQQFESEFRLAEQQREMAEALAATKGLTGGVVGGVSGGVVGGVVGGVPGGVPAIAPPAPPQAPQAPQPATGAASPRKSSKPGQETPEALRERLNKMQEDVKKRRAVSEERRQTFLKQLAQIKVFLIEALANHGDSLTHVKPNEFITLILTASEGELYFESPSGTRAYREVMSVQKSAITDYKAGKINLGAFNQKVLIYNN